MRGNFNSDLPFIFLYVAIFIKNFDRLLTIYSSLTVDMANVLKRVLVLGSGFTAGPLVEYLTRDGKIAVTVGEYNNP